MSLTARDVSGRLFERLEEYSRRGGYVVASDRRWVRKGTKEDFELLTQSSVELVVRFGRHLGAAFLLHDGTEAVVLIGFGAEVLTGSFVSEETDVAEGWALLALDKLETVPIAAAATVSNVVNVAGRESPGYTGHPFAEIAALLPNVRTLQFDAPSPDAAVRWGHLTAICARECSNRDGWIQNSLANEIIGLTENPIPHFPYESLCRSLFDLDPRSLFSSLYRCLEALYAFEKTEMLRERLQIGTPWFEVAQHLGDTLGWHPRHDTGLRSVFAQPSVLQSDLEELARALGLDATTSRDSLADAVRGLRNNVVHFAPAHLAIQVEDYDWNLLCAALAKISGAMFRGIYATNLS